MQNSCRSLELLVVDQFDRVLAKRSSGPPFHHLPNIKIIVLILPLGCFGRQLRWSLSYGSRIDGCLDRRQHQSWHCFCPLLDLVVGMRDLG